MSVLSAVAEFQRDLLVERTAAGLACARAAGRALGRRRALSIKREQQVCEWLAKGQSVASIARVLVTSRQTVMRLRRRNDERSLG
jgi:putative DNA-invertase from lambdoid prophage Rac